jgi:hypothetical protein
MIHFFTFDALIVGLVLLTIKNGTRENFLLLLLKVIFNYFILIILLFHSSKLECCDIDQNDYNQTSKLQCNLLFCMVIQSNAVLLSVLELKVMVP